MGRRRDYQRQRVYDAERKVEYRHDDRIDIPTARETVALLAEEFDVIAPSVKLNRRIRAWGGWYRHGDGIELPRPSIERSTILHEFAHHLAWTRDIADPGHGGGYVESHLEVVEAWHGPKVAEGYRMAYVEGGVVTSHEECVARTKKHEADPRNGDEGIGYVVVSPWGRWSVGLKYPYVKWYESTNPWGYGRYDAKVARRRSTAEKWAEEHGGEVRQVFARRIDGEWAFVSFLDE